MKHTRKKAAMAGGLAIACLAAVAVGTFAVLGVAAGAYGWAMYGGPGVPVESGMAGAMFDEDFGAEFAAMDAELAALDAEYAAFLEGIGVAAPGLTAGEAAEVRERAAPVLTRYAEAYADGAEPSEAERDALNAEYDAILAELGAAPQALTAEQARAIAEYRDAEAARLNAAHAASGGPGVPGLSAEDAAELERIDREAEAAVERLGLDGPGLTVEEELALAARLAPLEQRYEELHVGDGEPGGEIARLDAQGTAIVAASGAMDFPQITEAEWAEFEAEMATLAARAAGIYERAFPGLPQ